MKQSYCTPTSSLSFLLGSSGYQTAPATPLSIVGVAYPHYLCGNAWPSNTCIQFMRSRARLSSFIINYFYDIQFKSKENWKVIFNFTLVHYSKLCTRRSCQPLSGAQYN